MDADERRWAEADQGVRCFCERRTRMQVTRAEDANSCRGRDMNLRPVCSAVPGTRARIDEFTEPAA